MKFTAESEQREPPSLGKDLEEGTFMVEVFKGWLRPGDDSHPSSWCRGQAEAMML